MITTINEFRKLNEYHVEMPSKIELTFVKPDEDTGNFIYKGNNGEVYISIDGVIHDVTDQREPLGPVYNTVIKKGEPVYNPEDRFGRNPGSKVAESVVNEESGDYSTETHAIASAINKNIEDLVLNETSGALLNTSEERDVMHGVVKFQISDPSNPSKFHNGQIVVEIFDNITSESAINESNKTDFILNYAQDLKDCVSNLKEIHALMADVTAEKYDEIQPGIEKVLSKYDSYIERLALNDHIPSLDEMVDSALQNEQRKGTEPQFMIFAIEELLNYLKTVISSDEDGDEDDGTPGNTAPFDDDDDRDTYRSPRSNY